jgi:hypothetical protein
MAAFPSALQRSRPQALMLHLQGLGLVHFRKGLGADYCAAETGVGSSGREAVIHPEVV